MRESVPQQWPMNSIIYLILLELDVACTWRLDGCHSTPIPISRQKNLVANLGCCWRQGKQPQREVIEEEQDVTVLWPSRPYPCPPSVWRLQVLRHIHSASRRLPDPDRPLCPLMYSLCLRSALIFQILILLPGDKCIKSLSSKHHALNSTSLLVSSSGF